MRRLWRKITYPWTRRWHQAVLCAVLGGLVMTGVLLVTGFVWLTIGGLNPWN